MDQILNLLSLTPEEEETFHAAAPGYAQRFAADGTGLAPEDYAGAQIVLGNPPVSMFRSSTALRWLQTRSAGADPYGDPGVLPHGAILTTASGAYGHSVSEHMFAMLLSLMKRLPAYRDQQDAGQWRDLGPVQTLQDAQVLVVGTGDLGSSFARLCKALGASTAGVRRDPEKGAEGIDRMYPFSQLDSLLPEADAVALMLPRAAQTAGLFDRTRLLRMKPSAILLNGGRGSVLDCAALAQVLEEGRLWGAGLDVTDPEPLPSDHPLWRQPRALITPHTAGGNHLADTERRVAAIVLENLRRYIGGEALKNRIL
ncbi:D-2-hydroxyacid dehydrogenase [Colidextribacter sp. OB.20]|uniref:D-2-hydroxyacid dehydrogenase n=1 Tax=Colidextribacter sp. OB.20 TaxID=2304568 RepID=UPI00136BA99D|nr:D-2-hydroxyacid dehydrogenase [Colidextribacter sp. OB.20]NBI10682.1 D-2-hydroxyacid dehydrogenase [Colidextribacter sp. OB.20]